MHPQVGGLLPNLWRCVHALPGSDIWEDYVMENVCRVGLDDDSLPARCRRVCELVSACCTIGDREDLIAPLLAHETPYADATFCGQCLLSVPWCKCTTRGFGVTPFLMCCRNNHPRVARALLDAHANPWTVTGTNKYHRLGGIHLAAIHDAKDMIPVIVSDCGANVNAQGDLGMTPLHFAALYGAAAAARALLEHGAKLDVVDMQGRTPLDLCTQPEQSEVGQAIRNAAQPVSSTPRDLLLRLPSLGTVTGTLTPRAPLLTPRDPLTMQRTLSAPLLTMGNATPRGNTLAPLSKSLNRIYEAKAAGAGKETEKEWSVDTEEMPQSGRSSTSSASLSGTTLSSDEEVLDRAAMKQRSHEMVTCYTARRREEEAQGVESSSTNDRWRSQQRDSDESSDELDSPGETRCFGGFARSDVGQGASWADEVLEEDETLREMDGAMEEMEAQLREARRRSEGMRAQCNALRARGERQDVLLGRSPEKSSMVPKLNLMALQSGKTASSSTCGPLSMLMNKAKAKSESSSRKTSARSDKSSPKKSPKSKMGQRKGRGLILTSLPSIEVPSSSDGEDSPAEPLSHAELVAGAMTARQNREEMDAGVWGAATLTPPERGMTLQPATARLYISRTCNTHHVKQSSYTRSTDAVKPHSKSSCKGNDSTDLDDLLADLSI